MPALFARIQAGPACSGSGSVAVTCAATTGGTFLTAVLVSFFQTPFTPPNANWQLARSVSSGGTSTGHLEIWYLQPQYNPGGITSVTFAGPSGTCRGGISEWSLPAGYQVVVDAPGVASGTGGATMAVAAAAGNAPSCLGVAAYADFFSAAPAGTWTLPSGWTALQGTGTVQASWQVYGNANLSQAVHTVTSGFSVTTAETGWCAAFTAFRPVRFASMGIDGGERLEVLALDPTSQVAIAGGDVEGLWRSADPLPGDTWQSTLAGVYNTGWVHVACLAWSQLEANTVYACVGDAASNGGFLVSADGGFSWTLRSPTPVFYANDPGTPPQPAYESSADDRWVGNFLAQDTTNNLIYVCEATNGVMRSADLGATWTSIHGTGSTALGNATGTQMWTRGIAINPGDPKEIWVCAWKTPGASNGGVWHTADATVANPVWNQLGGYTQTVADLEIVGTGLYAACNQGGLYRAPVAGGPLVSMNGSYLVPNPGQGGAQVWNSVSGYVSGSSHVIIAGLGNGNKPAGGASTSLIGATVQAGPFPAGTTRPQTAASFNTLMGGNRTPALNIEKVYFTEGQWPSGLDQVTAALSPLGCKMVISMKPSRAAVTAGGAALAAEQANLKTTCQYYQSQGINFDVILWQEPLSGTPNPFASGAEYVTYYNAYAPTVRALGITCIWDMNGWGTPAEQQAYYPGDANVDRVDADYYCDAYVFGRRLDTLQALADGHSPHPIPMGVGEVGNSINANDPGIDSTTNTPYFTEFMNYLVSFFQARTAAGKKNGDIGWFNAESPGGTNEIAPVPYNSWLVPGFQKLYDALSLSKTHFQCVLKLTVPAGWPGSGGITYADLTNMPGGSINVTTLPPATAANPTGRAWWKAGGKFTNFLGAGAMKDTRVLVDPNNTENIYAWATGGIWRSNDGGVTWATVVNGMAMFAAFAFAINPNNPDHIVLTTGDYGTLDITDPTGQDAAGVNVLSLGSPPGFSGGTESHCCAFDPLWASNIEPANNYVFAGANQKYGSATGGGVFARASLDTSWSPEIGFTKAAGGAACIGLYAGRDASGNLFVLAAGQGAGLYMGTCAGDPRVTGHWTWAAVASGSAIGTSGTTGQYIPFVAGASGQYVYCFDRQQGIYRSADFGATWTLIWQVTATDASSGYLALNPSVAGELWISTTRNPNGLYRLSNAGAGTVAGGQITATAITTGVPDPGGLAFYNGQLYCVWLNSSSHPSAQLMASADGGVTWTDVGGPEIGSYVSNPGQLAISSTGVAILATGYNIALSGALSPPAAALTVTSAGAQAAGQAGIPYTGALAAAGGTPPYSWTLATGALPPGLALNSDGTITGTPTATGGSSFTATVTDSATPTPATATSTSLSISVTIPLLAVTTTSLPAATIGTHYSQALTATAGTPPYTWALGSGSGPLPAGLALSAAGVISGTPTAAGTATFTVQVTDTATPTPATATAVLSIHVPAPSLAITTVTLPPVPAGEFYTTTLTAAGGVLPRTWACIDPVSGLATPMPAGFTLNTATGVITGVSPTLGANPFTVQVTDHTGGTATAALTLVVVPSPAAPAYPAQLMVLAGGVWVAPQPETLTGAGAWQPDSIYALSGGAWT